MAGYFIGHYNITDPEKYGQYIAGTGPTLAPFEAKVLVAGHDHEAIEGSPQPVTVVLEFKSKDDAKAWYSSEAYQKVIHLRHEATENGWAVITEQFVMPS